MSNSREFVMCNVLWTDYQPTDWVIQPVWQVFKIGRGRVIAETELNPNGTYPVYSSQTKNNGCLGFIDTYDFDCTQITWTTDGANAGTVFLRRGKHNCTNVCGTLLPLKPARHDIHFYTFFLGYVTQFYKRPDTNGAKIMNGEMASIRLAVPPVYEQRQIAAYLNRETAKIDKLIAKQHKLIKLLQEKRQAVISQAVTKGLDPNVKMKDSGVEWLGEVPEHWDIQKLSRLTLKIGSGKTPRGGADTYKSEGILFIRSQNVYDDGLRLADVVYIDSETDSELSSSRVQPGDIFLNITGASIGRTCIAPSDIGAANVNQHVCIIRLSHDSQVGREYLSWFLKSNEIKNAIDFSQNGAAREGLNFEQISNFRVPIPTYEDQKVICEKITEIISGIDTILHRCRHSVDLLIEHRQALIAAAVTGKIDVRGLVTDEEVAALDAGPVSETTEEDFESEVAEADYITEEE
jgi:type I restriction enzyme, S subunit